MSEGKKEKRHQVLVRLDDDEYRMLQSMCRIRQCGYGYMLRRAMVDQYLRMRGVVNGGPLPEEKETT